jgi:hypothetical protein
MRGRNERRSTLSTIKQRVRVWLRRWIPEHRLTPGMIGVTASHHHTCPMCGNPRRHFRERTRQEQLADLDYEDWLYGERW